MCEKTLRQFWHTGRAQKMVAVASSNGTSIAAIVMNPKTRKMSPRPHSRDEVLCLNVLCKQDLTV